MAALSADRNTKKRKGPAEFPVKASIRIYQGSLVVLDAGYLAPARTATGLIAAGMAMAHYDNSTGSAGAIKGAAECGTFKFGNSSAGDLIAQADVGADCYIVDDQTVAKSSGTGTRSRAGKIMSVDSDGVWVKIGVGI